MGSLNLVVVSGWMIGFAPGGLVNGPNAQSGSCAYTLPVNRLIRRLRLNIFM